MSKKNKRRPKSRGEDAFRDEKYSYENDYFFREVEREARSKGPEKPFAPAMPVNVKREPGVKRNGAVKHSVYDEIALRHQQERQARAQRSAPLQKASQPDGDDTKVYTPGEKDTEAEEIFSNSDHSKSGLDTYSAPVNNDSKKQNPHTGVWITVIIALAALCLCIGGVYALLNGYLDGLIALL